MAQTHACADTWGALTNRMERAFLFREHARGRGRADDVDFKGGFGRKRWTGFGRRRDVLERRDAGAARGEFEHARVE